LAAGLTTAARVVAAQRRRDPQRRPLVILVTDGRATAGPDPVAVAPALAGVACVVVDCESGPVRLGLAARLAGALRAEYLRLDQLSTDGLRAVAVDRRPAGLAQVPAHDDRRLAGPAQVPAHDDRRLAGPAQVPAHDRRVA
jgi:magnesium chelatase subunit D